MWSRGKRIFTVKNEVAVPNPPPVRILRSRGFTPVDLETTPGEVFMLMAQGSLVSNIPDVIVADAAAGFVRYSHMLSGTGTMLDLAKSPADVYKDFVKTSFAGQWGIPFSLKRLNEMGYHWFAHFEHGTPSAASRGPDYVMMHESGIPALLESKGTLETDESRAWETTTGAYRSQVQPWLGKSRDYNGVSVHFGCGFAVTTLTDAAGTGVYVVHTQGAPTAPVAVPFARPRSMSVPLSSPIVVLHYARWLRLMGLRPQALALEQGMYRNGAFEPPTGLDLPPIRLFRYRYRGQEYHFSEELFLWFILEPGFYLRYPLFKLGLRCELSSRLLRAVYRRAGRSDDVENRLVDIELEFGTRNNEQLDGVLMFADGAIAVFYDDTPAQWDESFDPISTDLFDML